MLAVKSHAVMNKKVRIHKHNYFVDIFGHSEGEDHTHGEVEKVKDILRPRRNVGLISLKRRLGEEQD